MKLADEYEALLQFLYRAPIGLIATDASGAIEMINPASASLLMPLSPDGGLSDLFSVLAGVAPQLRQLAADVTGPSGTICEALRFPVGPLDGGEGAPRYLSLSILKQTDKRLMAVLFDDTDATRRAEALQSLESGIALRLDALTGMPNRLAVIELLQGMLRRAATETNASFTVFYIRCTRLTQVNDAFGNGVGDRLLNLLADRLRTMLPAPGDPSSPDGWMVAHVNDDRFIVLSEHARLRDEAQTIARRLVDVLKKPYLIGPGEIHCPASIGVVSSVNAEGNPDQVLQDASLAMAAAERAGDGRYAIFTPAMREQAMQRGNLEADLRRALDERQLFVVYQPVVGLQGSRCADGAVDRSAGIEALVRWQHPTRGILNPDAFIGIAEESGMIRELGEFVLRTACHQFMAWQAQLGPAAPRMVAVNLSRSQLGQSGLTAMVADVIQSSSIPPARLQLEVTESLAAQNHAVQARLHELKSLGVMLGLDDFGTGYSSLSSLHQLPVDTVKIDRSFVTEAPLRPDLRALIDATVRVAHALNLTTVAEGIETEAQLQVIRDLGSDRGQGFLFSKPLSSDHLVHWLTHG